MSVKTETAKEKKEITKKIIAKIRDGQRLLVNTTTKDSKAVMANSKKMTATL